MDDLMTARLSRFLNGLFIFGFCLGWILFCFCLADQMSCASGDCWMTDQQRELWKYDGRGPVGEK